jgi:hypothetical protein
MIRKKGKRARAHVVLTTTIAEGAAWSPFVLGTSLTTSGMGNSANNTKFVIIDILSKNQVLVTETPLDVRSWLRLQWSRCKFWWRGLWKTKSWTRPRLH